MRNRVYPRAAADDKVTSLVVCIRFFFFPGLIGFKILYFIKTRTLSRAFGTFLLENLVHFTQNLELFIGFQVYFIVHFAEFCYTL